MVSEDGGNMLAGGFMGLERFPLIILPSSFTDRAAVWASDDREKVYAWKLPERFLTASEEGEPCVLAGDGIPELGPSGEHIVVFHKVDDPLLPEMPFYHLAVHPAHEEVGTIRDSGSDEKARANLYLGFILLGSMLAVNMIAFLFLNHLIGKQLTRPVEELSTAAAKVMQGDLDLQVGVEEGEGPGSLERASNARVEGLRTAISASAGEEREP